MVLLLKLAQTVVYVSYAAAGTAVLQLLDGVDQGEGRGAKYCDEQRGEKKARQREKKLHRSFLRCLLGALAALSSERIRKRAHRPRDRSAKAIGLNQHRHQAAQIVNAGSLRQVAQGLVAFASDANLQIRQLEFFADVVVYLLSIPR